MSLWAHLDTAFFITWLAAAVRLAGPVLLASLGENLRRTLRGAEYRH
ncbi:hypothetical protein ACVWZY_003102 [Ewingella americana]